MSNEINMSSCFSGVRYFVYSLDFVLIDEDDYPKPQKCIVDSLLNPPREPDYPWFTGTLGAELSRLSIAKHTRLYILSDKETEKLAERICNNDNIMHMY